MMSFTKKNRAPIMFVLGLFLFTSTSFAESDWAYCYDSPSNRIYFQTKEEIKLLKGKCFSKTYYQGQKNFDLILDTLDEQGFPRGEAGAPLNMNLNSGRNILVTHWNDLSKNNLLIVLEPNLKNHSVKIHCQYKNYSNRLEARVDSGDGRFKVRVREPLNDVSDLFRLVWKNCDL